MFLYSCIIIIFNSLDLSSPLLIFYILHNSFNSFPLFLSLSLMIHIFYYSVFLPSYSFYSLYTLNSIKLNEMITLKYFSLKHCKQKLIDNEQHLTRHILYYFSSNTCSSNNLSNIICTRCVTKFYKIENQICIYTQ